MLNTSALNSYHINYLDATSTQLVDTIITKQIAALNDQDNNATDLFLGATGSILINVGSSNALNISSGSDGTTTIAAVNGKGISIIPGDTLKTMVLGSVTFTETPTTQKIVTNKAILDIVADLQLTGNEIITGDLLTAGALVSSSMNILRDFTGSRIGFGFRITDNSNLELIKYDNKTNLTKRIALFGNGDGIGSNDTNAFDLATGSNNYNSRLSEGLSLTASPWVETSSSNIVYTFGGNVGIQTLSPSALFTVSSTAAATNPFAVVNEAGSPIFLVNKAGQVQVDGNILPTSNVTYDLGSSNLRFRDLYLSGNTINLGSNKITTDELGRINVGSNIFAINILGINGNITNVSSTNTTSTNVTATNVTANTITATNATISHLVCGDETTNTLTVTGTINAAIDSTIINIGTSNASIVNIGTASGTQTVNFGNGSGATTIYIGSNNDTIEIGASLRVRGNISVDGTVYTASDSRVKEEIQSANVETCYSNVRSLPLREFKWKDGFMPEFSNQTTIGWIAQEVQSIIPQAVSINSEFNFADFHRIQQDMLVKNMYGCIQYMAAKLDNIESRMSQK
jgi:hypothetical protein